MYCLLVAYIACTAAEHLFKAMKANPLFDFLLNVQATSEGRERQIEARKRITSLKQDVADAKITPEACTERIKNDCCVRVVCADTPPLEAQKQLTLQKRQLKQSKKQQSPKVPDENTSNHLDVVNSTSSVGGTNENKNYDGDAESDLELEESSESDDNSDDDFQDLPPARSKKANTSKKASSEKQKPTPVRMQGQKAVAPKSKQQTPKNDPNVPVPKVDPINGKENRSRATSLKAAVGSKRRKKTAAAENEVVLPKKQPLKLAPSSSAEEATIEWLTNGHEWIGQNVLRVFDDSSIGGSQMATVTGWVAADGSDEALWHVVRACGWASTRACVCAIILLVLFWLYI